MKAKTSIETIPQATRPHYERIVALTDAVCREYLNEEYAQLIRRLAAALARKRPSPIVRGKPEIWAAGIVHAVGMVNFLFDPAQTPHLRSDQLSKLFGVSQGSTGSKSKLIRNMFRMHQFDPDWCLPSKMDSNPLVWLLSVNGLIVDIRYMPREAQEVAYMKGLIPYIPADKEAGEREGGEAE